jgi:hypothetical protein
MVVLRGHWWYCGDGERQAAHLFCCLLVRWADTGSGLHRVHPWLMGIAFQSCFQKQVAKWLLRILPKPV